MLCKHLFFQFSPTRLYRYTFHLPLEFCFGFKGIRPELCFLPRIAPRIRPPQTETQPNTTHLKIAMRRSRINEVSLVDDFLINAEKQQFLVSKERIILIEDPKIRNAPKLYSASFLILEVF